MTAASKQTLPAPALSQPELDRIRFVKATGKCSSLHLANGTTGVCDRLWEMRPATEDELKALAGKRCRVCLGRLTRPAAKPKAKSAKKPTKPAAAVKVTKTEPAPRKAKTLADDGAKANAVQQALKAQFVKTEPTETLK